MARLPRYTVPGQPQHLIQRGNNREPIFFVDQDYPVFLECLKVASDKYECAVHAYVLMTNHVHLLVSPHTERGIGQMMQSVGRRYVQYVNYLNHRTGTLWEGRYRAAPIDSQAYLLACMRYIELNPVRAEMVKHPRQYRWSSYAHHAEGKTDPLIQDHTLFRALGTSLDSRCEAYRALFRRQIDPEVLNDLRQGTHKGWALGNDRFRKRIESATQRRVAPLPKGGKRAGAGRPRAKDD